MGIHTNINGYVLAGGKSTRMGTDKGLVDWNGKPLIQHVTDALMHSVSKVFVVTGNPAYSQFGYPLIADLIPEAGPAGGIYSALQHSETDYNFIVACDMPCIKSGTIDKMLALADASEITVAAFENPEPLFGIYRKSCAERIKLLMEKKVLSLQQIIRHFETRVLSAKDHDWLIRDEFVNMNRLSDLQ